MPVEITRYITDDLKFLYVTTINDDETVSIKKYMITLKEERIFEQKPDQKSK